MGAAVCSPEPCKGCRSILQPGVGRGRTSLPGPALLLELRRRSSSSGCCIDFTEKGSTRLHVEGESGGSESDEDDEASARSGRSSIGRRPKEFRCKRCGKKPRGKADEERWRQEALLHAARCGNFKKTVDSVDGGADVHGKTLRGQTALMLCAASHSSGTLETVKFLLATKALVGARDDLGWTPLLHACRNSQRGSAALLLEKAASLEDRAEDGKTAAILAAIDGCDNLVMDLLGRKAPVEEVDRKGYSLLAHACEEGHRALVRQLLKWHADPSTRAKDKTTPLMIAARKGDVAIGEMLFKKRASLNSRNSLGDSALLVSLKACKEAFALWLVDMGADVKVENKAHQDARSLSAAPELMAVKNHLDTKLRVGHHEDVATSENQPGFD